MPTEPLTSSETGEMVEIMVNTMERLARPQKRAADFFEIRAEIDAVIKSSNNSVAHEKKVGWPRKAKRPSTTEKENCGINGSVKSKWISR